MAHSHRLTILNLEIDDVSISALGAKTAVALSAVLAGIQNSFLVKRVKYMLKLSGGVNEDELIVVFLNPGNASLAEVQQALTQVNTIGPTDRTQTLLDDNIWNIWQKTVRMFHSVGPADGATVALGIAEVIDDISLGKGMVAREDEGVAVHAMNIANNAMAAANQEVTGIVQLWGVWLND